jgi:hypothetical protein
LQKLRGESGIDLIFSLSNRALLFSVFLKAYDIFAGTSAWFRCATWDGHLICPIECRDCTTLLAHQITDDLSSQYVVLFYSLF